MSRFVGFRDSDPSRLKSLLVVQMLAVSDLVRDKNMFTGVRCHRIDAQVARSTERESTLSLENNKCDLCHSTRAN